MKAELAILPGDGIGPEVTAAAVAVLDGVAHRFDHSFEFTEWAIGGAAIDTFGVPLPDETLAACAGADAVLLGAVGGPAWSHLEGSIRPEQGLLALRQGLGLFANLRPIPVFPSLVAASPLKNHLLEGVDLLFVRELTGGIYFGPRQEAEPGGTATDTMRYSAHEIERIARVAFRAAAARRGRVTSVDKANVLATSRLWRRTVEEVARECPEIELRHLLVDACAMQILRAPAELDVVLTSNLFGDILSDEASMLAGSLGLLPSASLGAHSLGLFEPVHGSAPDLAGTGEANPIGAILSSALALRHGLGLESEARCVEAAVALALEAGFRTGDLCGEGERAVSTTELTGAVLSHLA